MKIGYQGIQGSNSEEAAKIFVAKNNLKDVELVPLVNSKPVIDNLTSREIDYGVVAIRNSIAGPVKETADAIHGLNLTLVDHYPIPIHHCVYKYKGVDTNSLKYVISHEQALRQTKNTRARLIPNLIEVIADDMAKAAKQISQGDLPKTYAVVCRKNAGEMYGLELVYENIEDNPNNATEFGIYKL